MTTPSTDTLTGTTGRTVPDAAAQPADAAAGPGTRLLDRSWPVWVGRVLVLAAFLAVWELLVDQKVLAEFDVSRPTLIFEFLVKEVPTSQWWYHTWVTLQELIIGVAAGVAGGLVSGAALGLSPFVSRVLDPYIVMLNSLPRVAVYPLFLTWFGLGIGSKIALVIGIVYFIMLINTRSGMVSADPDVSTAAQVLGATKRQRVLKVDLPSAVPAIFAGVRLSISYGLLAVVTGELLASYAGLGQRVSFYSSTFQTTGVMGVLAFLAVLATLFNIFTERAERRLLRWRED
jgi:NitT/TauT family transport system permease protein